MTKLLAGIRVLDLTNVLAGPFCCQQLAHLGADVIKVEVPGRGDLARQLGADAQLNAENMGVSFLAQNAGKRSVTLNLKRKPDREAFLRLVDSADVVVENFRPGVMDRLGLGASTLRAHKPTLIYCAISGFGQDGPWVNRPAYDQIIQGASGLMAITGDTDSAPLRAGSPMADTVGGLTAAFAIAAALNARPRGCVIDVSMLTSLMATMGWVISNHLIAGQAPGAHGNENPTSAPSGTFRCRDGLINIAANKDEQWLALTEVLDLVGLRADPRFVTREDRKRCRKALSAALEERLSTETVEVWIGRLNAVGVPAGPVLSVPEALDLEQVTRRGFIKDFGSVGNPARPVRLVTTGIVIDGVSPSAEAPPPALGADSVEIWTSLGLTGTDIAALGQDNRDG